MPSVPPSVSETWSHGLVHLGRRPMVLLTVALVLGILWADWALPPVAVLGLLLLLVSGFALFCTRHDLPAASIFLLLGLFLLGALLHTWRLTVNQGDRPPTGGRAVPRLQATVAEVRARDTWAQTVVLAELVSDRGRVAHRALLRLPATPVVQLADRVTLTEVSLWRPKPAGTPGEYDRAHDLARDGIYAQGRAQQISACEANFSPARTLQDQATKLRRRMLEILAAAMPGPDAQTYAELLAGMVYGRRAAPVARPLTEVFRDSGTLHLLVVSGTQVSIIAFSLIFLVRGTRRVLPVWGIVVVGTALFALAVIAGLGASINRAVAMAVILLGSFASGRRYDFPTALALSALALCLLNTATVFDLGAQLTYACSLGVYLALPPHRPGEPRHRVRELTVLVCWGTFGAWLLATPLLVATFQRLVLLGALANLIVVPLSVVLLYLGLLAIGLGLVWLPLAVLPCAAARVLLEVILQTNRFCAGLPLAGIDNIAFSPLLLGLWYAGAGGAFWALRSPTPWALARRLTPVQRSVIAIGVVAALLVWLWLSALPRRDLSLEVIDVGAAQCVLLQVPGGGNVLLDAGTEVRGEDEERARRVVLPLLALRRVRSLQAIVLSHLHEDHCNLAAEIMQVIPTRSLVIGPLSGAEASWPAILQMARQTGTSLVPVQAGGRLQLGADCWLELLEPRSLLAGTADDTNNNCLVSRLVYRQVRVLLPADLQAEGEQRLLVDYRRQPEALRAEVLLAAHHASVNSNTPEFIQAVAPEVVLISCGSGNRRPRPEGLLNFERLGLPIRRTDVSGTLRLTTDGQHLRVKGYRN